MNKLTKIKYLIFHPHLTDFPKYMAMVGILYSTISPAQAIAKNAEFGSSARPAMLALAETRMPQNIAATEEQAKSASFAVFYGSTIAGQANPFTPSVQTAKTVQTKPQNKTAVLASKTAYSPINGLFPVKETRQNIIVTAYSSTPDQTDSSPFITAMGSHVRDGIVATNFLKFGTKVKFPQLYGDKIFVVEDRMAKRNSHKIDIWMESRSQALQFGVKRLTVEILE